MMLKSLHGIKPDVSEERIDLIWNKINKSNKSKQLKTKRKNAVRYLAIACSIAGIIVFFMFNADEKSPSQSILDYASERKIHTKDVGDKIQLLADDETVEVEGVEAELAYNTDGSLKINSQIIKGKEDVEDGKNKIESKNGSIAYNELRVPFGKRAFLTLSDGTSIWVNTGTTIIYPVVFSEDKREIYIEGEIYAEVFHDKNRPFIIKTNQVDVKVLGTVLNLKAYKEDKNTNVVLVSGLVDVKPRNGKSTIIHPNQRFSYSEQASTLTTVNVGDFISWKDGVYIFKNEPIENILLRLARYYNVTMKLPATPSGISCSGKLELKGDLTQLLNGLSEITSLNFGVNNNEYKISFMSN
jgi:transmembrane sensor